MNYDQRVEVKENTFINKKSNKKIKINPTKLGIIVSKDGNVKEI